MGEAYSGLQGKLRRGGKILTYWDQYTAYNREHYEHKYKYVVEVQPNWANILIIDSDFEYFELARTNKKYFIRMAWRQLLHLDFKAIALIDKANEIIRKLAEIGTSGGEPDKGYEGWRPNTSGTWYPCSTKDYRIWYEDDGTYRVRIG